MEADVSTVRGKRRRIEDSILVVLFLSALCLAGADFVNYGFFISAKVVSLILFLTICSLWQRQSTTPYININWRKFWEVLAQDNPGYSPESQQVLKLTVDGELSEEAVDAPFPPATMAIPRRRRRRIYRHTPDTALQQLSLW